MTYRCGMGRGMAQYGFEPGPPRFTCDDCGAVFYVEGYGAAPRFMCKEKPCPPGWKNVPVDEFKSRHYCKVCKTRTQ